MTTSPTTVLLTDDDGSRRATMTAGTSRTER